MNKVRIATRGSALALWQARFVAGQLEQLGADSELVIIETQGDKMLAPFAQLSGQGFFTKAVQDALLEARADVAVHSYKDLPSAPVLGLQIAAIPTREDARDVLLALPQALDSTRPLGLKAQATVGTSAVRRRAQVEHLDSSLLVRELRGNVPTRVEKLRNAEYDAIIIAAAGVHRLELDLSDFAVRVLEPDFFVPAPAQGALALECRSDDTWVCGLLQKLESPQARVTVSAERGLMARFDGGCQLALGALAQLASDGTISLLAWYGGGIFQGRASSAKAVIENVYAQIDQTLSVGRRS